MHFLHENKRVTKIVTKNKNTPLQGIDLKALF